MQVDTDNFVSECILEVDVLYVTGVDIYNKFKTIDIYALGRTEKGNG